MRPHRPRVKLALFSIRPRFLGLTSFEQFNLLSAKRQKMGKAEGAKRPKTGGGACRFPFSASVSACNRRVLWCGLQELYVTQACTEACDLELTRGTCFVASHVEVVAYAVLLVCFEDGGVSFCFHFVSCERTGSTHCM